jgi:hypothetical protein
LADDIPPCAAPKGVSVTTSLNRAPLELRQSLHSDLGDIVPPGGAFDATDVVSVGKNRRLIFIWHKGQRWIVATERGGTAYNDPIIAYDVAEGTVTFIASRDAIRATVCSTAVGLLDAIHRVHHSGN